jgi:hypothetical protein
MQRSARSYQRGSGRPTMKAKPGHFLMILLGFALASCAQVKNHNSSSNERPTGSTSRQQNRQTVLTPAQQDPSAAPSANPRNYGDARKKLEAERVALSSKYLHARTSEEKLEAINRARETMTQSIYSEFFPAWYGTTWDFNGTTETPGQGKIACGYFVSTVLRDAGVKVQRVKLAQQASENIILSLTTSAHIKRFRQTPISDFVEAVRNWGPGLYVVGLDIHVGFILNVDGQVYFIHSSYINPYSVVKEPAGDSKILASSRYRILGKISADDQFIERWLRGEEIVTRIV